jgi:hypothetical protein
LAFCAQNPLTSLGACKSITRWHFAARLPRKSRKLVQVQRDKRQTSRDKKKLRLGLTAESAFRFLALRSVGSQQKVHTTQASAVECIISERLDLKE